MEMDMGLRGERFVEFLKRKLREKKGQIDGYKDTNFAAELSIEYTTLKRWLTSRSVDRIDIDNYFLIEEKYGKEFTDYLKHG